MTLVSWFNYLHVGGDTSQREVNPKNSVKRRAIDRNEVTNAETAPKIPSCHYMLLM